MKAYSQSEEFAAAPPKNTDDSLKVWDAASFPMATGSIVYHLMRDGVVVYVGMSTSGMLRVCSHIAEGIKKFDSFRVKPCKNEHAARIQESRDIWDYNPEYNRVGAFHPHYAQRNSFCIPRQKLAIDKSVDEFLASLPCVVKSRTRFWHVRFKYPQGHPKHELSYWQSQAPDLYADVETS